MDDLGGKRYCFAPGSLEVVCLNETLPQPPTSTMTTLSTSSGSSTTNVPASSPASGKVSLYHVDSSISLCFAPLEQLWYILFLQSRTGKLLITKARNKSL